MVFILETDNVPSERRCADILSEWNSIMPNHKLLIIKRDTIKILDVQS